MRPFHLYVSHNYAAPKTIECSHNVLYLALMKKHPEKSIRKRSWADRALVIIPALILAVLFITITLDYTTGERLVAMRYLLFVMAGIIAFILPYISFPDSRSKLFQLANYSPSRLLREYIKRHQPVWGMGLVLIIVIATADSRGFTPDFGGQLLLVLHGILFLAGIYLYASYRYLKIGKDSQQWQEGDRGRKVRIRFAEMAKYPIDPGSIPSLISSVLIAVIGMMAVVTGAMVYGIAGLWGETGVSLLLFLFGINRYVVSSSETDHFYYQTNAFFSEFFGVASGPGAGREPLKVDQLWWIPTRWKARGWGLMLQMDRKLPAGRFIAVGHLFIWVLAYQDTSEIILLISWGVFAALHHSLLLLTANPAIAPKWWLRQLDQPAHWVLSRFWIQVRWLLPLMFSMSVMKLFFALFEWSDLGLIALLYLSAGAVVALIISIRYERHWTN